MLQIACQGFFWWARTVTVPSTHRKTQLATPNYGYEKRQKELAKKRKKEDKLKQKAERKGGAPGDDGNAQEDGMLAASAPAPDTPLANS